MHKSCTRIDDHAFAAAPSHLDHFFGKYRDFHQRREIGANVLELVGESLHYLNELREMCSMSGSADAMEESISEFMADLV